MDIYPEDLETACRVRIQQMQSLLDGTFDSGRGYDGSVAAMYGITSAILLNLWLHIVPDTLPVGLFLSGGAGASVGYVGGFFVDRYRRSRQPTNKVTARAINLIQKGETDALRLEYFGLLSKLISMRSSQDMAAEESIRCAVRDIGSGIEKMPGQPADDLLLDAETFQQEASRLLVKAAQESDPVVAASLQRQSVAQNQRGDAVSRNSALARRNQILRREMTEHIKTLTTMLSAATLDDSNNGSDFTELVENIQQVASEAKSLTEAKKELVSALTKEQGGKELLVAEPAQLHRQ